MHVSQITIGTIRLRTEDFPKYPDKRILKYVKISKNISKKVSQTKNQQFYLFYKNLQSISFLDVDIFYEPFPVENFPDWVNVLGRLVHSNRVAKSKKINFTLIRFVW